MLKTIDRVQIVTHDTQETAAGWRNLLGAEFESEDMVAALSARRTSFRLGKSMVEFLEPDGDGIVSQALLDRGRPHLFAGGVSTDDFDAVVDRLREKGIEPSIENDQAFFNARNALGVNSPMVLSAAADRPPTGNIEFLYEVTLLAKDARGISAKFADLFGLDNNNFVSIESERFGYNGVLTLFSKDDLHRYEVITPFDDTTTMGRFYAQAGPSYYMCFAETSHLREIEEEAHAANLGITVDRPDDRDEAKPADQAWLHPATLGGVMLGLSRPTMAWQWSGHPERVEEIA